MSLTLIAIVIAAIGIFGAVTKAYFSGEAHGEEKVTAQYVAAQKKADDLAKQLEDQAATRITDMDTAFAAGESKAKVVYITAKQKGASDVQKYAVFSNPVCTLPAESLGNLNSFRGATFGVGMQPSSISTSDMHSPADSGQVSGTVPKAGQPESTGRKDGNPVPTSDSGHGAVGAVHPKPRPLN